MSEIPGAIIKPFFDPLRDLSKFAFSCQLRALAQAEVAAEDSDRAILGSFSRYIEMTRARELTGFDGYNALLGVDLTELCRAHLLATERPFLWFDLCCGELRAPFALHASLNDRGVNWQGRIRTIGVDLQEPTPPLPPSTEFRLGNVVGFQFGEEIGLVDLITMTQGMQYILSHPPGAPALKHSIGWRFWQRGAAREFSQYLGAACCVRTICDSYDALRLGGVFAFCFPTDLERFGVLTHLHRRLGKDFHFERVNAGWYDGCATNGYVHLRKSSHEPLNIQLDPETEQSYWRFQPYPPTQSPVSAFDQQRTP